MNTKNRRTLEALFKKPVRIDIEWKDIEVLLYALGGTIRQGTGSRVRVTLKTLKIVIHIPHPQKEICVGLVKELRKLLKKMEIYTHEL